MEADLTIVQPQTLVAGKGTHMLHLVADVDALEVPQNWTAVEEDIAAGHLDTGALLKFCEDILESNIADIIRGGLVLHISHTYDLRNPDEKYQKVGISPDACFSKGGHRWFVAGNIALSVTSMVEYAARVKEKDLASI